MKLLVLLFVVVLALASAVPQTEEHYKSSDELDDFIHSPDRPVAGESLKEVVEEFREHVKLDSEKVTDKVEKFFKKGSMVTGSIVDYLKSVSEKGKNKVIHLIYRGVDEESSDRSVLSDFNIRGVYGKLKELIKSNLTVEELKSKAETVFGKGSQFVGRVLKTLKEQEEETRRNIIYWLKRMFGKKED